MTKQDIINQFQLRNIDKQNLFINPDSLLNENSVSVVVRKHRFSEKNADNAGIIRSDEFVKNTIQYIKKAANYMKSQMDNPKFYIFSNDTNNLNQYFSEKDNFFLINHKVNKPINDFYLSTLCKHFIVGPSTFHWWSAYLSKNRNKICVHADDQLKFSSNKDIYPKSWRKINFL